MRKSKQTKKRSSFRKRVNHKLQPRTDKMVTNLLRLRKDHQGALIQKSKGGLIKTLIVKRSELVSACISVLARLTKT